MRDPSRPVEIPPVRTRALRARGAVLLVLASTFAPWDATATEQRGDVVAGSRTARVTRVVIRKSEHSLTLLGTGGEVVASYKVAIGPGGPGPKTREGDRVTPVGRYRVTMHQPSVYRIFLRLDYPNEDDRKRFARLKASGEIPAGATIGGDIGIHGPPSYVETSVRPGLKAHDWTAGCIAVDEDEIVEIARRVRDGTRVDIEE